MLVAGVDSSTQSTKVVLCDAGDGTVVGRGSAPHPPGTEADPADWWAALRQAGDGLLDRAAAVGVAGQQHGMVVLDDDGEVIRPALLWNDLRSAPAAAELVREFGGPQWWASETGSVPTASFTVTKLRWLATHEPANANRAAAVLLPHDWLTWRLLGGTAERAGPEHPAPMVTDRGDASGTGYFSPAKGIWLPDVVKAAVGRTLRLPRVAAPGEVVGQTARGAAVSAGTGDNMGAALGLGLRPGDVAVSIGTSGTAFAVSEVPADDPSGRGGRVRRRHRAVPAAGVHDQRGPGAVRDRLAAGHRPRRAVGAGAGRGARRGRDHPAALPGRRAHAGPARRDRGAARADHPATPPGRTWPGPRSRRCSPRWPTRPTGSPPRAGPGRRPGGCC